jgi:hypothetical protein
VLARWDYPVQTQIQILTSHIDKKYLPAKKNIDKKYQDFFHICFNGQEPFWSDEMLESIAHGLLCGCTTYNIIKNVPTSTIVSCDRHLLGSIFQFYREISTFIVPHQY